MGRVLPGDGPRARRGRSTAKGRAALLRFPQKAGLVRVDSTDQCPAQSGNKRLKNTLFYSAWVASNSNPLSKAYYDRKRAEGKHHNAAVTA